MTTKFMLCFFLLVHGLPVFCIEDLKARTGFTLSPTPHDSFPGRPSIGGGQVENELRGKLSTYLNDLKTADFKQEQNLNKQLGCFFLEQAQRPGMGNTVKRVLESEIENRNLHVSTRTTLYRIK